MFNLNEKYVMAQIVELIGTDKQKEHFEKYKTFKSAPMKKAILKELATMVKYEEIKEGRKIFYLITEVFEEKQEKEDLRKENSGIKMEISELGILKYLARRTEEEQIPNTKSFLSQYVGLCNEDFKYFKPRKYKEEKDYEIITMENIWYNETKNEIKNRLTSALRSLQNKGLINVESNVMAIKLKGEENYILPSRRQKQIVLNAEKTVMDQLNINSKKRLYFNKSLSKKFYYEVGLILEKENIVSYYYGVDIIQADNYFLEKEINILEEKLKVNEKFINLYQKKIENTDNEDLFGDTFIYSNEELRYTNEYVEKAKELNDKYIKID